MRLELENDVSSVMYLNHSLSFIITVKFYLFLNSFAMKADFKDNSYNVSSALKCLFFGSRPFSE